MRFGVGVLIVFAAASPGVMAAELAGTWEGKLARGVKTFSAGFDLEVSGDRITGAAFVEGQGYAPISDGRLVGDRFRFTARSTGTGPASGLEFDGVVAGNAMTLAMVDGGRYEGTLRRTESQITGPVSTDALPEDLAGKWTARFVGRIGDRPKMFSHVGFDFEIDGNMLKGMAHAGAWPGDCPISGGRVENGRFSFLATGLSPSSSGIPVLRFEGEIHGTQLKMILRLQIAEGRPGVELPMEAVRR